MVLKAGTSITKFGMVIEGDDYIEKDVFDEMAEVHVMNGDVLVASTGTGTLGKAGVYEFSKPAVADSHVTIIRVNTNQVDPYYLADYLRIGAGAHQIQRLYTSSTGLIELTPEDVDQIIVELPTSIQDQRAASKALRAAEAKFQQGVVDAEATLLDARKNFSTQ